MAKQLMNEAERFLLEHWADARLLEESMEDVRKKYEEVFQQTADAVRKDHPELDKKVVTFKPNLTDGQIGFGRKSWPISKWGAPAGFWVDKLRLDVLAAEDPYSSIWVPKESNLDFDAAREICEESAKTLLTPQEFEDTKSGVKEDLLYFSVPSSNEFISAHQRRRRAEVYRDVRFAF